MNDRSGEQYGPEIDDLSEPDYEQPDEDPEADAERELEE